MFWDRKGFREKKVKTLRTVKIRDFITDNGDDNDSTVKNNNSVRASHFLVHFLAVLCKQTTWKFQLRRCCYRNLSWCFTGQFATTIFSAIHRYNIVVILFWMVAALFQHCNDVLRYKSSLRIVPCNGKEPLKGVKKTSNNIIATKRVQKQCPHRTFYHPRSNLFCNKSGCGLIREYRLLFG